MVHRPKGLVMPSPESGEEAIFFDIYRIFLGGGRDGVGIGAQTLPESGMYCVHLAHLLQAVEDGRSGLKRVTEGWRGLESV